MKHLVGQWFWFMIFSIIIIVGFYFGNINIQFGTDVIAYSPKTILKNLDKIQNISGELWITPYGSYEKYMKVVGSTQHKLKMQTYDFTEKRFKELFKQLVLGGTDIQLIMENRKFQQYQSTFKQIQNYFSGMDSFQIKSDKQMGTEYVHSKINIVDSGFIIQTANLTHSSFFSNREHFFWSQDSGVLESLETIFDRDWNGKKIRLEDIHPNLVVCNINCRTIIEKLLADAKESVIIQTQYITDSAIMDILQSKVGIEMKILVADTDSNLPVVKRLESRVRRLKKPYNHTKMVLIDKKILLLGSMNLSSNSLDNNREIGILLIDPLIIGEFLLQFEKDRQIGL